MKLQQINKLAKCPLCGKFELKSKQRICDEYFEKWQPNSGDASRFMNNFEKIKYDFICCSCNATFKEEI